MKVKIEKVAPHLDGTYELDLASFDMTERQFIWEQSKLYPTLWIEAVFNSHPGMTVALATIVCRRHNKLMNEDIFWAIKWPANITFHFDAEDQVEDEAGNPTEPGKPESKRKPSGRSSKKSSDDPA